MIDMSPYPMCAARLKFFRANLSETGFTYYWAAVALVADIKDAALRNFGGFDFSDKSDANGKKLLARLEQFIRDGLPKKAKSDVGGMSASENSVRALLGAFGIKVSKLNGVEDYWSAARVLWPGHIDAEPKVADVFTLNFQMNRISKTKRKIARQNIKNVRREWRA